MRNASGQRLLQWVVLGLGLVVILWLGQPGDGAGAALAAAARALRSMMPESSRSRAVVAFGALDGELPTFAVSALSEKSIEFSSRCPVAGAAALSEAAAAGREAAPLL